MKWKVFPSRPGGSVVVPPSKSHTIRAVLVATLAEGDSRIVRPLATGDGASAIGAARSMGAGIVKEGDALLIRGIGGNYNLGTDDFDLGNSGTGTNLFASAAALGSRRRRFSGDASLSARPVRPLLNALEQLGASFTCESEGRDLPFSISGPLAGGSATVSGVSSQFVSSLLLSTPLLPQDSVINVVNLRERPYVEITLWWLDRLGIRYEKSEDLARFRVFGKQRYRPIDMAIPGDFSSAAFPAIAAAITCSSIDVRGIDFTDPQGDKGIFDVLASMGVSVEKSAFSARVDGASGPVGREIDLNTMPDALPAVAVLGCVAKGVTRIVNVAHARIKETDRIAVMTEELGKMGADIVEEKDGMTIRHSRLRGARVDGRGDHRVVMALALAGMIAEGETLIDTAESAEVTYPSFQDDFVNMGARMYGIGE
jgi:3-phosphoshikimate 1-carboxyvinyltransferase